MNKASERHLVQLDGIRTAAIAAVVWSHWASKYTFGLPLGTGVQLFFVLSGFLITGILLDNKTDLSRVGSVLRQFYARRALRIFPLFYATILVALILNVTPIRSTWPWHISYLSNFYFVQQGDWDPKPNRFGHFWSLAVEEQFYFVWPFIVLFLSWKRIRTALICMIVMAPIARIIAHSMMPNEEMVHLLPFSNLDALATGGLFAYLMRSEGATGPNTLLFSKICLWAGLPLALMGAAGHRLPHTLFSIAHTGLIFVYGWVVYRAAIGFGGAVGAMLSNGFIVYLGKISYGLYVFHHLVPGVTLFIAEKFGFLNLVTESLPLRFCLNSLILISLAMFSWHLFEKPVNDLKRFFPYDKAEKRRDAAAKEALSRGLGQTP